MSFHQFQIFEKIRTEESQIDTSIELSERVYLLIKQNTYFLGNRRMTLYSVARTSHLHCYILVCPITYEGCYYMQFLISS